ncbi:hypothetical protein O4N63_26855, partial [Vibrio parahaemolyticus]|nr:hypothetical protein [Vibrio parahaemolyticus]MCZ6309513.1 hypothetical protein [Vibrio parahaemolyticus]
GLAYSTVFGGKPPKQTDLWGGLAYSLGRAFVSAPPSQSFSLGRKVTSMLPMCIFRTPKIIINQAPQRGRLRD